MSMVELFIVILVMEPSNIFDVLIVLKEITFLIVPILRAIGVDVSDARVCFNYNNTVLMVMRRFVKTRIMTCQYFSDVVCEENFIN